MTQNSNAIITLCSHLCVGDNIVPLEPKEWSELARRLLELELQPKDLFELSKEDMGTRLGLDRGMVDRILRLLDRNASLTFELEEYENMGIYTVTRADSGYPSALKRTLGNSCPPLFYYAGDVTLLNGGCVGYVGSRTVTDDDTDFAVRTVEKTVARGYGVVSGGAKGIDSACEDAAIRLGAPVVEYLSDSMHKKMKRSETVRAVRDGKLLLLSVAKPDAAFNVGVAMMRNRYIYAHSVGTVVVRSEYNKGGTWAGAVDNLKHGWCKLLCRDKRTYPGNRALIELGAVPIDDSWCGDIDSVSSVSPGGVSDQISLFDS